jgi:uncharacterized membrane protein YczE
MKKLKFPAELAFFAGLIILAVGIAFFIKADFGMSVIQSVAYLISLAVPELSFGTVSYLLQFVLIVTLCIIVRKFSIRFIISFGSAVLYGYTLDLVVYLMRNLSANNIAVRILFFAAGFFLVVVAVTLFFRTNIPLMPYDIFVTEIANTKKISKSNVKIIYDLCYLAVALTLSLSIFGKLVGIGIGTIISGLFSGVAVKFFGKLVDKVIVFEPMILKSKQ